MLEFKETITGILDRSDTLIDYYPSQKSFAVSCLKRDAEEFNERNKSVDRVFIASPNSYEWLVIYFACALSGKSLFSADFQLSPEELNRRISVCKPDLIIVPADKKLDFESIESARVLSYCHPAQNKSGAKETEPYQFVQFTSGTTGNAKGVVMRYSNIAANIVCMQELCRFCADDQFLLASAMSHPMGHIFMLLTLSYGKRLTILESPVFLPQAILNAGASIMVTPPVMLNSLKAVPEMVRSLKRFRYLLCVGAPLDDAAYLFYKAAGVSIMNGYGMTEAVSGIAMSEPDSSGHLIPISCCDIQLASDGEILVRGASVCANYLDGKSVTDEGWYHTNDLGEFLPNGKLVVTGRKDNLVVLQNGYKIALEPMEAKINRTAGILDCVVRVLKEAGKDIIECDVVAEKNCAESASELKRRINQNLDFTEKVERLNVLEKLPLKSGKKERIK